MIEIARDTLEGNTMNCIKGALSLTGLSLLILGAANHSVSASAPPGAAQSPNASEVAGSALFQEKCTSCHVASQTTSLRKTGDQWAETVNKMITYGAKLSDDEYFTIVDYLEDNYGPQ